MCWALASPASPPPSLALILSLRSPHAAHVLLSNGGEEGLEQWASLAGPGRASQASLWGREGDVRQQGSLLLAPGKPLASHGMPG